MSTPVKLAGFLAVLALVLGAGFAVGNAVGPFGTDSGDDANPSI